MKTPNLQPTQRRCGRPADNNGQNFKAQILDVAETLFAEKGYAAVSIRQIADTAGVNPALVHYYFGSKHALLQAVLAHALEPLVVALAELKDSTAAPAGTVAGLLLSMAAEHPNIPRLMTREVLLPGGQMQDYFIRHMAPQLGGALPGLLAREKSAGRLRDNFDPAISALLIIALSIFPFVARSLAEPVLGIDFDRGGIDSLRNHVAHLLDAGMTQ